MADTNEVESNGVFSDDKCDILIGASGTQRQAASIVMYRLDVPLADTVQSHSTPIMPAIDGLDDFKGRLIHTGDWSVLLPSFQRLIVD
jgi:hypothetical protein